MVDLKNLTKRILLQWRLLVVGMLVLAFALTVLGALRSRMQADAVREILLGQMAEGYPEQDWVKVPKVRYFDPKLFAGGAVLGFVAVSGTVFLEFVMTGRLRCESDLTEGYSLSILGRVRFEKRKRLFDVIDRAIERLFDGRDALSDGVISLVATDLKISAKEKGLSSLYLTGRDYLELADELAEAIGDGVTVRCGELAISQPDRMKEMLSCDGVVLLERIDHSRFDDIERTLDCCERHSIPVLGCLVIQ